MNEATISRRRFLLGSIASAGLMLRHSPLSAAEALAPGAVAYRRFEDVYRNKWTWDRVVRGTHGTNCAGNCAFDVYVKDGIVWREEQQGEYEAVGDAPDYGPRGCNKGLRHSAYMYGRQRVLYPMKRAGARGEGKWQRISWEQAAREIADRIIDCSVQYGPQSISLGSGTQLAVKRASMAALGRFANICGFTVPEFYSGVGDLPSGAYMTTGVANPGDTMASVFKSRCVLVWAANPAVTRIPDAHFFWEARYNGTDVIAISPEFTPTSMHSSLWINPKPGSDIALAMAMIHVLLSERLYDAPYVREQTDLPFLVRVDDGRFLRESDLSIPAALAKRDSVFYLWDEATDSLVKAPATDMPPTAAGRRRPPRGSLKLGDIRPALEGRWKVRTRTGDSVEVTTVFELLKARAAQHSPEVAARITGVHAEVIVDVARRFAAARPAMIYAGYAVCKWQHGDLLQRSMMLMLSLTGNLGVEGGGLQIGNTSKSGGMGQFMTAGVGPAIRMVSDATFDYETGRMRELNERIYGSELAREYDEYYQESLRRKWFPTYTGKGWKMGIFAGENGANWRASGNAWRKEAFDKLETIVAIVPDLGLTAHQADYVLPVAHHYERNDIMMQSRVPYLQCLVEAVPPLGESADDWTIFRRLTEAISRRAAERGIGAIHDDVDGRSLKRDFTRYLELYTMDGRIKDVRDVIQFLINTTPGVPKITFDELAARGMVRLEHSATTAWDDERASYQSEFANSVVRKRAYKTLTGRQQFYIDHEWFLKFDEALPGHREPLRIDGYPLQMMMGHARHGIHSMWRDDPVLLKLQRGEPDIYINPADATARGVIDGDLVRVHNPAGQFIAQAHLSNGMPPGMLFMYHGWDPMMFRGRQNFSSVICTAGLIKPTSMAGGYGHLGHRPLSFAPNQTYKDFTVNFEKYTAASERFA